MSWENIVVNSKIVGHISSGVYRSAGGALKELVSNAFDADASQVYITTNWPSFDVITCQDNGIGMTLEQFHNIMTGGIGTSAKRTDEVGENSKLGRPLIGRLGIGMLGIAQLCHEFHVTSHCSAVKKAFTARVKLIDHLREKIDHTDADKARAVEVGQFEIEQIDYDPRKSGTTIVAADMRATIVRKFRELPGQAMPKKFTDFLSAIHDQRSMKELGQYWQMVWDIAIASPVAYIEGGPFNWDRIEVDEEFVEKWNSRTSIIKNYGFDVVVDGLSLKKPIMFPCPNLDYYKSPTSGSLYPIDRDTKVYGRRLKLSGYIYLQDGIAVEPMELRGLLIRLRNVAVGKYDSTFLDFPKIEGPRFNWLSGEVYVDDGLEHALNIDRDSFNQTHAHFVALQQTIHEIIPEAFSDASKRSRLRSQVKKTAKLATENKVIDQLVSQELSDEFRIVETRDTPLPVQIDLEKHEILVNSRSPMSPKSKTKKELSQKIGVVFELAMQATESKRRQRFYDLLNQLLDSDL